MKNVIFVSSKKFSQILLVVIGVLTLAGIAGSLWSLVPVESYFFAKMQKRFIYLFDPNGEANIIAWYSASTILLCSLLLGIIAFVKKVDHDSYTLHWGILSFIFLYLSADEAAMLHEIADKPLREFLNLGGFFYYSWIIPAGVAFLIFGMAYLKFLIHLPSKTRWLFIIAGGIFVGGAIGLESFSGLYDDMYMQGEIASDWFVIIFETTEEFMEMLGIVIFIHALLDYISSNLGIISFSIDSKQS